MDDLACHVRCHSVIEYLQRDNVDLNIISVNHDNYSYDLAYEDVKAQIKKRGIESIDMIIAANDIMALGALKALNESRYNLPFSLKSNHKRYIPVFGVDGIAEAMKAINSEMLEGTAVADFSALAYCIMSILTKSYTVDKVKLQRLLWYKVDDRSVYIPYKLYTRKPKITVY